MVDFESGLNTAANRLRLALGDSAENPRFVETVARIGYRFVATVTELPVQPAEPALPGPDVSSPLTPAPAMEALGARRSKWGLLIGAAVLVTAIVLLALWWTHQLVQPSFQQVTFRSGSIANARFGPDGETILYTANWDAAGNRLYLANTVSPESRALDFKYARLTGAYQITLATHSASPPPGGCKWVAGDYLGQVMVKTPAAEGQAAFLLSIP